MEICEVCGQNKDWHKEHKPRHEFTSAGGPLVESQPEPDKAGAQRVPLPGGDPVLRLALISAGVLTPGDIEKAERMLRAAGAVFTTVGGELRPMTDVDLSGTAAPHTADSAGGVGDSAEAVS